VIRLCSRLRVLADSRLRCRMLALHRDESGQAMVEFVLVFPVQLLLSLTILQFAFIAHAHLVVEQAAFMAARAAAVADVPSSPVTPQKAAERIAARTCAALTSGEAPEGTAGAGGDELAWSGESEGRRFNDARQREAYAHLQDPVGGGSMVKVMPYPQEAYVACEVSFDYVMLIPVANHLFAKLQEGSIQEGYNDISRARGRTCYRIKRVSFIPTPWTRAPR
jgi:hypothetical protein